MSSLAHTASRFTAAPREALRALATALRTTALVMLAGVLLALAYVSWIRDLPVFAVGSVEVVGTDDGLIVSTLTGVAREMTTLHVEQQRFDEVAARFPVVASIHPKPDFPTGIRLVVDIREPAAVARLEGGPVPVAADGTLLPGVNTDGKLPVIRAEAKGPSLVGEARDQVAVVGAAPGPLVPLIEAIGTDPETGIGVQLEGGVELRFGTPRSAERKWAAAAAVLADDTLSALTYIDVSAPDRPAVGGAVGGRPIEVEVEVAETAAVPATTAESTAEIAPETASAGTVAEPPVEPQPQIEP